MSLFLVVVGEGLGEGGGVFLEDVVGGGGFGKFVEGGLEAWVVDGGVHDVGFHEEDGAVVEAVGEEVAGVEVGVVFDGADVVGEGVVDVGGEFGDFRKGLGDGLGDEGFFFVGALEEFFEEGEALVGEVDFVGGVGAVEEDVEVCFGDEGGVGGVAPCFGVEVEAEDEVGFDGLVDELGAGADFGGAVEEAFGEFFEGGGVFGVFCEVVEVFGAEGCDGFCFGADEGDFGAHFFEDGFEFFGNDEGHVAFGDRFVGADLEPAFFDFSPWAADVAGVDGDVEFGEWFVFWRDGEGLCVLPGAGYGEGFFGGGEVEDEGGDGGVCGGDDFGVGGVDGDVGAPGVVCCEDFGDEFLEVGGGDGVLVGFELGPIGVFGEDGERGLELLIVDF